MIGGFRIGRILGIPIYLHPTWFLVFLLVTFALGGELGAEFPRWDATTRNAVAALTAALFFVSILLHELGHSVLALRHRVAVRSITLFVFGGVALLERDADDPRAEFEIAIAGPVVSAALGLVFLLIQRASPEASGAAFVTGWLVRINLAVAIFNLLPGFPLDGGRVLRAWLWARSGDPAHATRVAAGAGQLLAYGFIALGGLQVLEPRLLQGARVDGLWLAFVGWFLLTAAGSTLRQLALDHSLAGLRAQDVMAPVPARIAAATPVARFARDLVMRGRRWALVEQDGETLGLVSHSDVRRLDPDAWETTPVARIATPRQHLLVARPETPVRDLLLAMGQRDINQIPILEGDRILGAVTREGLVHAIDLREASRAQRGAQ
jgi:Zn-dependent protease/predicted transcriptional regulator